MAFKTIPNIENIEEAQARAKEIVAHASESSRTYRPELNQTPPGDQTEYCAQFFSTRCVFSITEVKGKRFRHLSMSVQKPGKFPQVDLGLSIATWFGFTGGIPHLEGGDVTVLPASDWMVGKSPVAPGHECIVIAQLLPEPEGVDNPVQV